MSDTSIYDEMQDALKTYDRGSARTLQSREGRLGPSDIGFCRQKAVIVTKGTPPSDDKSMWAANVGTAIHNYVEAAFKASHPDWLLGSIDNLNVTATLPSGATISGHPDIVIPSENMLLDIKTVNGFGWTRKNGPSLSHRYQRHLYAMGAMQMGILDPERLTVGNIYYDRSGADPNPLLFLTPYEDELTVEIDSWISDVIYAVKHGEDAARDVAPSVCAQICEFYTACRGGALPVSDNQTIIDSTDQIKAIDMYIEGKRLKKEAEELQNAAKLVLDGINGSDGRYQIRWTTVSGYDYPAGARASSLRLDVKPLRKS